MGKTKANKKENKFSRFMKIPIRVLIKLKNSYIQSMNECSGRFDYGTSTAMGGLTAQVSTLPRSFSTSSAISTKKDEDLQELIRVASTKSLNHKIELDFLRKQQGKNSPLGLSGPNDMPRSQSVGIGKIDEDKSVEFQDHDIEIKTDVYPRSRSYAVSRRRTMFQLSYKSLLLFLYL